MVASRQVLNPLYISTSRQRGRVFGALAEDSRRTTIPFLRKYIIPAAKRAVAVLLEFAAPETAEVVSEAVG